jgi:hypothetical protein
MTDINNAVQLSSTLRAQNFSTVALKSEQQKNQAVINQLQQTLEQGKALTAKPVSIDKTAPRGTYIDFTA